jgi:hypothetical protein
VCGFGEAGGGDTSTGAGSDGDETVFEGGQLLQFENFCAVRSAFGTGVIAASAAGRGVGSDLGFIVPTSCSGFAKTFFVFGQQTESSAFRPACLPGPPQLSPSRPPTLSADL